MSYNPGMKTLALLLLLAAPALADDAPLNIFGGAAGQVEPGDVAVRMKEETVYLALDNEGYTVDVRFDFENLGPSTNVAVGFPELAPPDVDNAAHETRALPLAHFETWVDGKQTEVRELPNLRRPLGRLKDIGETELRWRVKDVRFEAGKHAAVRVRYDAKYDDTEHTETPGAHYLFGTGRGWAGTIGRALFLVTVSSASGRGWPQALAGWSIDASSGSIETRRLADDVYGFSLKELKPEPEARFNATVAISKPWEKDGLADCHHSIEVDDKYGDCHHPAYGHWRLIQEPIDPASLEDLTRGDLRTFREAFYAGRGRKFRDPELRSLFRGYLWYQPPPDGHETALSPNEAANVAAIVDRERRLSRELADAKGVASFLGGDGDLATLADVARERRLRLDRPKTDEPYRGIAAYLISETAEGNAYPFWREQGSVTLERTAAFTGTDFAAIKPGLGGDDRKTPALELEFTREAAKKFAALTAEKTGRRLAFVVGGRIAAAPKILHPITTGRFEITGESKDDVLEMARAVSR